MPDTSTFEERNSHEDAVDSDVPPFRQVWGSLFTPSWTLGIVLAFCVFLPAFRGCNGNEIRLSEAIVLEQVTANDLYLRFLMLWPPVFGLLVFAGTLLLTWTSNPQRAVFLWMGFAGLIVTHTVLLLAALIATPPSVKSFDEWTLQDVASGALLTVPAVGLPLLLTITFRRSRNWYYAATWMQLALAVSAAVSTTYVIPSLLLVKELLYGGKLMITCSVGLVVTTAVQYFDGYRALTRRAKESPLQISVGASLILMAIGGLACTWILTCLLVKT